MKKIFYSSFIMLGIIALTFYACKKDNTSTDDQDMTSVQESAQADETFSDTFTDVSTVEVENPGLFSVGGTKIQSTNSNLSDAKTTCATITVTTNGINEWPKTVTFDFKDGCTGVNDVTRKGKIIAVFSKSFKEAGAVINITFDNYYVNDNKIEGTKTITNNGKNTAGNYTFTVNVSKSKISNIKGTVNWDANRTMEWIEADNSISITGSATGTNSKGKEFTVTITKPLIRKLGCKFIVAGTLEIKPADHPARVLDYGNGDCDANATVSIGGISKAITLKK